MGMRWYGEESENNYDGGNFETALYSTKVSPAWVADDINEEIKERFKQARTSGLLNLRSNIPAEAVGDAGMLAE